MMDCTVSLVQSANPAQSSAAETEVRTMPQPRRGSCVGSSELMTFDLHTDTSTVRNDHTLQLQRRRTIRQRDMQPAVAARPIVALISQASCHCPTIRGARPDISASRGRRSGWASSQVVLVRVSERDIRAQRSSVPDANGWLSTSQSGWMDGWAARGGTAECTHVALQQEVGGSAAYTLAGLPPAISSWTKGGIPLQ
jgi:hypothetical protein